MLGGGASVRAVVLDATVMLLLDVQQPAKATMTHPPLGLLGRARERRTDLDDDLLVPRLQLRTRGSYQGIEIRRAAAAEQERLPDRVRRALLCRALLHKAAHWRNVADTGENDNRSLRAGGQMERQRARPDGDLDAAGQERQPDALEESRQVGRRRLTKHSNIQHPARSVL